MELRIVNENPKYPPFKLIEPTTLGYIHLAAVVQPRRVPFMPMGPTGCATREISGKVTWDRTLLHTYMVFGSCWPLRTHPFRVIS